MGDQEVPLFDRPCKRRVTPIMAVRERSVGGRFGHLRVTGIAGDHPVDSGAFSCAKSLIHSGVTIANIRQTVHAGRLGTGM